MVGVFFFKQKTAYEMRISDWSSDVCSSDLGDGAFEHEIIDGDAAGVVARQRQRDCAAGTLAGTSDERNLPAQVERVVANHVGFLLGCGGLCRSRSRTRACRGSQRSADSVNVEYRNEAQHAAEPEPTSFNTE